MSSPFAGILSSIGNVIAPDLSAQAAQAEEQLQLAFSAMLGSQLIMIVELGVVIILLWKRRA